MSTPFLSEIKIVSFNFPPKGWALCNGQLLPINQNQALFSLLGTTYGGNGQTNFALPNMRGRLPIHVGQSHTLGEAAGSTSVTINLQQLPTHQHLLQATNTDVAANRTADRRATSSARPTTLRAGSDPDHTGTERGDEVGGSQPHNNMMPYLVLNFIIALQGIFPSRN